MRVLVVEDHQELAEAVAAGLRREGMAVDLSFDGDNALARASRSGVGRARVGAGLRMETSSLSGGAWPKVPARSVTRRERKLLPCCNRPAGNMRPWRDLGPGSGRCLSPPRDHA